MATLLKANNGVATTISATKAYFQTPNSNLMAGFSSWGPTDVDFRVKPDVVAPGVNVLSSQPRWTCNTGTGTTPCWAFFQGTSMATPAPRGHRRRRARSASGLDGGADPLGDRQHGRSGCAEANSNGSGHSSRTSTISAPAGTTPSRRPCAKVALDPVSVELRRGAGRLGTVTVELDRAEQPARLGPVHRPRSRIRPAAASRSRRRSPATRSPSR